MTRLLTDLESAVRLIVYGRFTDTGSAPSVSEIAAGVGAEDEAVREALEGLEAKHALTLDPVDRSVLMAHPFSAVPTPYPVTAGGLRYFACCAWDALAMPPMLGRDALIEATCAESGEPLEFRMDGRGREPSGPGAGGVVHILVPFGRFWDDVGFT
ncbi:MAG: organomercurial lyase [Gemmatimonadota bacterium]